MLPQWFGGRHMETNKVLPEDVFITWLQMRADNTNKELDDYDDLYSYSDMISFAHFIMRRNGL